MHIFQWYSKAVANLKLMHKKESNNVHVFQVSKREYILVENIIQSRERFPETPL